MLQITTILIMGLIDAVAIGCGLLSFVSRAELFSLHLSFSLGALLIWWASSMPRRFAPILGCAIGPLGVFIGIILPPVLGLIKRPHPTQHVKTADYRSQDEAEEHESMRLVRQLFDGRLYHPAPQTMGSLLTMIKLGSVSERIGALSAVVRNFDARLTVIVVHALNDPDQTVRALAAATAAQVAQTVARDRDRLKSESSQDRLEAAERLSAHAQHNALITDASRATILQEIRAIPEATGRVVRALLRPFEVEEAWRERAYSKIDHIVKTHRKALATRQTDPALEFWLSRQAERGVPK